MREAAESFLSVLSDGQRDVATYPFDGAERTTWAYTPGPRGGLALADMDAPQRAAALALLEAGLSAGGARTARAVMGLEPVLRALEEAAGRPGYERRDPEHYWFSVFGDPSRTGPWGWRVGGHHVCVHVNAVGDAAATVPLFLGANPARVPDGPQRGLRVLAAEEDRARDLLAALGADERTAALVSPDAPPDIRTGNAVRADIAAVPTGVSWGDLGSAGRAALERLLDVYLGRFRVPPEVDVPALTFAWAGSTTPGEGHYYALRSGTFLVEYDNTQDGANHVHTVVRDVRRDWAVDLLAAHYRTAH
ncbi:DUF3500 domain-containing protein [Nocardioides jiangsuensis]|uniref:DUF3500 domain-containing protein n=1 Tax=Nocardioides jiangsuensis TaxID=2866161 RepID=UPI0027E2514A|nr:DUF3500 domain-containing protein [Nocardioides jiangsuensis]